MSFDCCCVKLKRWIGVNRGVEKNALCGKSCDSLRVGVSKNLLFRRGRGNGEGLIFLGVRVETRSDTEGDGKSYYSQPEAFSHFGAYSSTNYRLMTIGKLSKTRDRKSTRLN